MPQLAKDEVRDIFEGVETSPDGTMRFHEMQQRVLAFREDRIKKMRVMYPLVARKPLRVGFGGSQTASRKSLTSTKRSRRTTAKVSPAVAPPTMFQKDKGLRNSDVATRINRMLCTRAYNAATSATTRRNSHRTSRSLGKMTKIGSSARGPGPV